MPTPRIGWNGTTQDLDDLEVYEFVPCVRGTAPRADSGAMERIVTEAYFRVRVGFTRTNSRTVYDRLIAWWSWASQGKSFSLSADKTKEANTTLSSAASAGATSLIVASSTGLAIGDKVLVRSGAIFEFTAISNITGAGPYTLTVPAILYAYPAGATVRSEGYFPALTTEADECPALEKEALTYAFDGEFREYKG